MKEQMVITMKSVLLLCILICAASAVPAEHREKASETAGDALPKEDMAAAPEPVMEEMMVNNVPEDPVPVARTVPVSDEAGAPEAAFNYCPDGWFSHNFRCFLFVNSPKSWHTAEEHCNSLGGNLASVSNPREYQFLQQLTQTGGQSIAWIGGFYLQDRWLWIDREGFYYTNWWSLNTPSSNPCIYLRTNSGWANTSCGGVYRFICSKNPFKCAAS
ncbi:ladderlectin-like [Parambassis ranga]|uniref:Ladderlectin-like n=1 Tax=Parambassis ranga TaxID=210632 RepID=A0A6P7IKY7_9TELE|nr:ladderlectin-like [Parambassis ranga]